MKSATLGDHSDADGKTLNLEPDEAMFFSILGVLLITAILFLVIWGVGRATLGR